MKILVVGSGGREHAVIKALKRSPEAEEIFALPGNGGIAADATCVNVGAKDIEGIAKFAKENGIDYAVVTPDDPLVLGAVDALEEVGVPCFGPRANAAIIEGSKAFSKALMKKYGIPTARYETFEDESAAERYIDGLPEGNIVVKADGLALGKGVIIAESREEAKAAVRSMMLDGKFGASGSRVVIEEFLTGPEVSVLSFTYGRHGRRRAQPLLYGRHRGGVHGKDLPPHRPRHESGGAHLPRLSLFRADDHPGRTQGDRI